MLHLLYFSVYQNTIYIFWHLSFHISMRVCCPISLLSSTYIHYLIWFCRQFLSCAHTFFWLSLEYLLCYFLKVILCIYNSFTISRIPVLPFSKSQIIPHSQNLNCPSKTTLNLPTNCPLLNKFRKWVGSVCRSCLKSLCWGCSLNLLNSVRSYWTRVSSGARRSRSRVALVCLSTLRPQPAVMRPYISFWSRSVLE